MHAFRIPLDGFTFTDRKGVRNGNVNKISIDSLRFGMLGRINPGTRERRNKGILVRGRDGVRSRETRANEAARRPAVTRTTDSRGK